MYLLLIFSWSLLAVVQESESSRLPDQLMADRRYAEADAAYSELLRSRPGVPDILLKRGSVRMVLGRYTDARGDLEAAMAGEQSAGGGATVHAQLGLLDHIQGRYSIAIQHYLIALRNSPNAQSVRDPHVGVMWGRRHWRIG